jgi:hypothetical protein
MIPAALTGGLWVRIGNRCLDPTLRQASLIVPFAPLMGAGGACDELCCDWEHSKERSFECSAISSEGYDAR